MSAVSDTPSVEPGEVKNLREFLTNYNKMTELCFIDCVWDFTTRTVKSNEESCALNCMEKYLKVNQRISDRFQEVQNHN